MTLFHDLRLRLVAGFAIVGCISQLKTLAVAVPVLGFILAAALMARPEARLWRRLLHVEGFMLLLFVMLPFTMEGTAAFTLGPLSASVEGFWRASLIAAKVTACVLVLLVLLGDVEPVRLGAALRDLRVPESLSRLLVMTARYTSLIADEARRLHDAMRARAFAPGSNRHTWRSYGNLMGMLLVRALDRARRVEEAMLCRGYAGFFPHEVRGAPSMREWLCFSIVVGLAIGALVVDWS